MKKIISVLLLIVVLFSFNACTFNVNINDNRGDDEKGTISSSFSYDHFNHEKTIDSFELNKDDVVNIKIKNKTGTISAYILREGHIDPVWKVEDIESGNYKFTAHKSGKHTIMAIGKNATNGSIKYIREKK